MAARTDLAWRILQIIALALPALGILLQAIAQLDWEGYDSTPHQYHISSSMMFLLAPITAAGIVSVGVIAISYDVLWLKTVAILIAISFLFVPLVLYSVYKRARVRNVEFLEQEKKTIAKAAERGEINEAKAEEQIEQINTWQDGFLSYLERYSNRIEGFLDRHPVLFFGFYGGLLIFGIRVLFTGTDVWTILPAVWLVLYSLIRIVGRLVPTPDLDIQT